MILDESCSGKQVLRGALVQNPAVVSLDGGLSLEVPGRPLLCEVRGRAPHAGPAADAGADDEQDREEEEEGGSSGHGHNNDGLVLIESA